MFDRMCASERSSLCAPRRRRNCQKRQSTTEVAFRRATSKRSQMRKISIALKMPGSRLQSGFPTDARSPTWPTMCALSPMEGTLILSLPKRRHVLLLFILSFVLWPSASRAQQPELSPGKRAQIESAVTKFMASTHVPGVSVAIVENDEYEWGGGFGFADVENNAPASEHTLFRLASISKSLTATAAMQLWERGNSISMRLSRSIARHFRRSRGRSAHAR